MGLPSNEFVMQLEPNPVVRMSEMLAYLPPSLLCTLSSVLTCYVWDMGLPSCELVLDLKLSDNVPEVVRLEDAHLKYKKHKAADVPGESWLVLLQCARLARFCNTQVDSFFYISSLSRGHFNRGQLVFIILLLLALTRVAKVGKWKTRRS